MTTHHDNRKSWQFGLRWPFFAILIVAIIANGFWVAAFMVIFTGLWFVFAIWWNWAHERRS